MENRVYYGEYSLKHWIDLILKENIVLPKYQRHFVWNEDKVRTLVKTLKNKEFVPPVTIGAFKEADTNKNLILDGQQRLTSILLAYLGRFPNEKTYKVSAVKLANENDEEEDPEEESFHILKWTLKELTQRGRSKKEILEKIAEGTYKNIELEIDEEFLKTTFLGFSYLVPDTSNDYKAQQRFYSSVFRNINVQGETLIPQESRASLYYLDENLEQFFDPKFFNLTRKEVSSESKADFVRYLAMLSQYQKDGGSGRIARSYKSKMEKYYEEYIYSVVGENASSVFVDFETTFPNKEYKPRIERLEQTINALKIPKQFPSIIDLDIYLFGLIYVTVILDKAIDTTKKDDLKRDIVAKIAEFKEDLPHAKAPGALKYLKSRIDGSINIYRKYTSA
jgi:hypothetical protein